MNLLKAIGYGFTLFAITFVIGSIAMLGFKLSGTAAEIVMFVTIIVVLFVLAQQYKIGGMNKGIQVGFIWLVVYALLDYFLIVQTFNKGDTSYYATWKLYLYYALIVVVPAVMGRVRKG